MRLLVWNIQYGRGQDNRVDLVRIAREVMAQAPDVVCLQEVVVNHPQLASTMRNGVAMALDEPAWLGELFAGWHAVYAAACDLPDEHGGRQLFGNLTLSRYALGAVVRHSLPFLPEPALPAMQRGALEVTVLAPGGAVRVINTHLEFFSATQRLAQIAALRTLHVEGAAHGGAPRVALPDPHFAVAARGSDAILCGDFNCPPGGDETRALLAPFPTVDTAHDVPGAVSPSLCFEDLWLRVHGALPHAPTAGLVATADFPAPVCFDRVYASGAWARRVTEFTVDAASRASDHQALLVDFSDTEDLDA